MKENKAPDKIYIPNNPVVISAAYSSKTAFNDVEYVCTDAFIEKACSWLKENCKDYIIVDIDNKYEGIDGLFLEDFRKYMEGETL